MKTNQNFPGIPFSRIFKALLLVTLTIVTTGVLFSQEPASVALTGNFQDELGCPGDWQPDCNITDLSFDGGDEVWQGTFTLPAGSWEYKATLDDSWDVNYGLNAIQNGPNILLNLAAETDVKFYYDHQTHWITDNINSVIAAVVGDFQDELGCSGDWQPECLQSWLQDPDGDGIYFFATDLIPVGNYECKVAHDESWDESYGEGGIPGGPNILFTVPYDGAIMQFSYDPASHILDIFAEDPVPTSVTVVGDLQSELGCPGDWQPECINSHLTPMPDEVWRKSFVLPAGNYEYKATINDSWDENYGANAQQNGPNILLPLGSDSEVRFYYDHNTHWITDNVNSTIAVAVGSFQSELGCPGDWQAECLRSWLQDPDGDGIYSFKSDLIPAGNYEAKVAHNESWEESYGEGGVPGGSNILFSVPSDGMMMVFTYDPVTHILTIGPEEPPPPFGTIIIHKLTEPPTSELEFSFTCPHFLTISAPGSIAGDYPAGSALFGPQVSITGITGELELVDDGTEPETNGCEPFIGFTPGKIAVVDRGACTFVSKVQHAQGAGAIGVVVVNHIEGGGAINMGGFDPGLTIPAIMISYEDGITIKTEMETGAVTATLRSELGGYFLLQHAEMQIYSDIPSGTYSISELNPMNLGFQLTSIEFTDPDNGSNADMENLTAMIDLDPGETVECTFINGSCALFTVNPFGLTFDLPANESGSAFFTIDNYADAGGADFNYTVLNPFMDDFENYTAGEQLSCQNPWQWTTWSGSPCSAQDPFISDAHAQSGENSVVLERNGDGLAIGLIKPLHNQNIGQWELTFSFYIPENKSGYFQGLSSFMPDPVAKAFECFLDPGGAGSLLAGSFTPIAFDFNHDTWQEVRVYADLNADAGEFWLNGTLIHSWTWTAGTGPGGPLQLAALNFYTPTVNDEMYMDDFRFIDLANCSFMNLISPNAGSIPDGTSEQITIGVDATGMAPGSYTCNILLDGNSCFGMTGVPVTLNISDVEPPVINLTEAGILWPPNHKYQNFGLEDMIVSVVDDVDGIMPVDMVIIESASSDEPDDAPGNGDGKTINDILIPSDCKSVDLRKERQGNGNGRVYWVNLSVEDAAGNVGTASYQVTVPHNVNSPAVDDSPDHTVFSSCSGKTTLLQADLSNNNGYNLINFPNPFSGSTAITFTLKETERVQLKVFNALGEEVKALFTGIAEADIQHTVEFNGEKLPGGIYYCKLQLSTGQFVLKKMILLK